MRGVYTAGQGDICLGCLWDLEEYRSDRYCLKSLLWLGCGPAPAVVAKPPKKVVKYTGL